MSSYQSLFNESTGSFNNMSFSTGAQTGYFLTSADEYGTFQWSDLTNVAVESIQGTANQVLVNGTSGTPQTGNITLTLPQSIATTSSPTFVNVISNLTGNVLGNLTGNVTGNLTGTILTAAQPNITSVGTLTGLALGGNLDMGNQDIIGCDVITAANYNGGVTGNVLGDLTGYVLQAAQPFITSLGTLTSLNVTNTASLIGANTTTGGELRLINSALSGFTIFNQPTTLDLNIGKYTTGAWQYNIITVDYATGAITIGRNINSGANTITAATFIGNLTGNVIGNVSGNLTGTILTAAQPNITSVGTLTSLTMGGAIDMGNFNINNADNITSTSFLGALTGQVLTASQPSITTLAGLTGAGSTGNTITVPGILNLTNHDGSTKGLKLSGTLVTASASSLNYNYNMIPGTAIASKTLATDGSNNIGSINTLSATTVSATTLTGTLSTASQPNVTTMAGLTSINGTTITGTDLAKITGITNGTAAASKALVLDSSRDLIGGSGIRNITSDGAINANSIVLTNQSGSVASPNISLYLLAGGLYYHKTNQLIGLSDGTSRIIECDKKNNIVNQDYKTQFNNAVTIYNASTDQLVIGTSLTTAAVNYTPAFLYGGSLTSNTVMHLRRLGSTEDLVIAAVGISGNWSSSAAVGDAVIRNSSGNVCIQNGSGAAQLIVTSSGIKLPTSGATASNLDFYASGSFTMNFSGPYTFSDTVYFTRVGKVVNLTFSSQVSNRVTTANYIQSTASDCPSYLRPNVTQFGFIYGADNNAGKQLSYALQNDGKLIIGNSSTDVTATFTAGSPIISGYYGFAISHSIS